MYEEKIAYGQCVYYEGKYKEDKIYDVYIQKLTCSFEIKENKIPSIQIKKNMVFKSNEYLTSSRNKEGVLEIVSLTLTSVDLKLFFEQYNVKVETWDYGWKFKSKKGMFQEYIDKWLKVKDEGTLTGNKGMRTRAKLMLNSLYGKLATGLEARSKIPYLGEDEIVHYETSEVKEKRGLYIPAGCFITALARNKTIRTCQAIMDYSLKKYGENRFIYADTDSAHTLLTEEELKEIVEIDPVKLGKWDLEAKFERARFIRQKTYIEEIKTKEGKIKTKITCSGMSKRCYQYVTFDNFKVGLTVQGNLHFKHVKGGVKLVESEFTIKDEKI